MRVATSRVFLVTLATVLPLSAKVIFPPTVTFNQCSQSPPPTNDYSISFTLKTDGDTQLVNGLVEQNSFLRSTNSIQATVTPVPVTINVSANPAKLAYGHNKAYVGFFIGSASTFSGFVTIDVSCVPTSTVTLTTDSVNVQAAAGSGTVTVSLPSEVNGAQNLSYQTDPIQFTLTPDTQSSPTSWITSASVPGFGAGQGAVSQNGTADLTLTINTAGLAARAVPYPGYLHIRDNQTGFGAADLTVWLTVTGSTTGNAALPHIAVNGQYTTSFYLINTSTFNSNYRLDFLNDNGQPLNIPVTGQGFVDHVAGSLAGGASAYFEAGDSSMQTVGGSALITADPSIGVQAMFRHGVQDASGKHYYEAAVEATTGSTEFQIPFDATTFAPTNEQTYTGIAIGNLDGSTSATINCTARDSGGNTIANAIPPLVIAAKGHWAGFDFPQLLGKRGTIDCVGSTTIGAVALHTFINGANSSLPVFLK